MEVGVQKIRAFMIRIKDITYDWLAYNDRFLELEEVFDDEAWDEHLMFKELSQSRIMGAFFQKRMIGYIASKMEDMEYIWTFAIDREYQGYGIGKKIMTKFLKKNKPYRLNVRTDNLPAIVLYLSLGFVEVGTEQNYYQDGCASFIMERV